MGQCVGIDDDGIGLLSGFVDCVDDYVFMVGLEKVDFDFKFFFQCDVGVFYIGQGGVVIDFGLVLVQKVQVWIVQDIDCGYFFF